MHGATRVRKFVIPYSGVFGQCKYAISTSDVSHFAVVIAVLLKGLSVLVQIPAIAHIVVIG